MKKASPKQRKPARKLRSVKKNAIEVPQIPPISKEMQEFYSAMKCIATAHNLLDKGLFKHGEAQAVADSLIFLRSLHAQVKVQAMEHPECDLIPELKEMKAKEAEQLDKMKEASKIDDTPKAVGGPENAA